jgi:hypothetical protein
VTVHLIVCKWESLTSPVEGGGKYEHRLAWTSGSTGVDFSDLVSSNDSYCIIESASIYSDIDATTAYNGTYFEGVNFNES